MTQRSRDEVTLPRRDLRDGCRRKSSFRPISTAPYGRVGIPGSLLRIEYTGDFDSFLKTGGGTKSRVSRSLHTRRPPSRGPESSRVGPPRDQRTRGRQRTRPTPEFRSYRRPSRLLFSRWSNPESLCTLPPSTSPSTAKTLRFGVKVQVPEIRE